MILNKKVGTLHLSSAGKVKELLILITLVKLPKYDFGVSLVGV